MADNLRQVLERQFSIAAKLANHHLDSLTDDECLWRPTLEGPHVQQLDDGRWCADRPEREDYGAGSPSIAWLAWHIEFWWTMALDRNFGPGTIDPDSIVWTGSAAATTRRIVELESRWRQILAGLSPAELRSREAVRWPFSGRPLSDVVAWASLELTKNAAEIGLIRFLYASR